MGKKISKRGKKEMKKYFIAGDIHSFYSAYKVALDKVGFDINNKNHVIVIAGDAFDRGDETVEMYNFMKSLPDDRLIYIRGNHEDLLEELYHKHSPERHDYSNGTVKTICHFGGVNPKYVDYKYWYTSFALQDSDSAINGRKIRIDSARKVEEYWDEASKKFYDSKVLEWINSKTVDYFELDDFIIVHAFIPIIRPTINELLENPRLDIEYDPDWRKSKNWYSARWDNPLNLIRRKIFNPEKENGKTLIFGHWFARYIRQEEIGEMGNDSPYVGDGFIAIDPCVTASGKVNVIVIDKPSRGKAKIEKIIS